MFRPCQYAKKTPTIASSI